MAGKPLPFRHQHQHNVGLTPSDKWDGGKVPQNPKERHALRSALQPIVDAIHPMGDLAPTERTEAGYSNLYGGGGVWSTTACAWNVFSVGAIEAAISGRAAGAGEVQRGKPHPQRPGSDKVQVLAIHREVSAYSRIRLCP